MAKTRLEVDSILDVGDGSSRAAGARKTVLLNARGPKRKLVGWLVVLDGKQEGEDFRLGDGQNIIGSDNQSDVTLHDETVSGKHASLRYKDGHFYLTDLDSTNGTFLNSQPEAITREELTDNSLILIGNITLKFKAL